MLLYASAFVYLVCCCGLIVCREHKRSDVEDLFYLALVIWEMVVMFGLIIFVGSRGE